MLYMLLFLLDGGLPWMRNTEKPLRDQYKEVGKMKMSMSAEFICSKSRKSGTIFPTLPVKVKLLGMLKNAYALKYAEKPDYEWYKQ